MAHLVETAAYADEAAWHGLGTVVKGAMSAAEVAQLAGIDWEVALRPTYVRIGDRYIKVPDRFAVVRQSDHSVLGNVGRWYQPIQNSVAVDFLDNLVASGELGFESAISLANGRRIVLLARIPEEITIGEKKDVTYPYLLLFNTHDGSGVCKVLPTGVRVVCNNTLTMALGSAERGLTVNIRHVGSIENKIARARQILNISLDMTKLYGVLMNELAQEDGLPLIEPFLRAMFPPKVSDEGKEEESKRREKKLDSVLGLYHQEPQSAWGLLNAFTAWVDHEKAEGKRGGRNESKGEKVFASNLIYEGADLKAQAADLLFNMTNIYERQKEALDAMKVRVRVANQAT